MNTTSSPPFTVSDALLLAFTFQAAVSFITSFPAVVIFDKSLSAALSIFPLVAASNLTVTSVPAADVSIPFAPFTLNWSPPVFDKSCVAVVPLSPPNFIVLSPIFWSNWLLFTASFPFTPSATLVIGLFPALIPSFPITTSFVPGVAPGIVIVLVVTESRSFRFLSNLYVYLWFPSVSTSWETVKFFPATNVTWLPDFTNSEFAVPSNVPSVADTAPAVAFHPILLKAPATSLAVATPSDVGPVIFPSVSTLTESVTTLYFTTPFASTSASVNTPFVKSNPCANVTSFLAVAPFAV